MGRRGNGEGSIYRRKNGSWSALVSVTLQNGYSKRISITAESYAAIQQQVREIKEQENRRIPYAEKNWTVGEYLDYWLQDVQSKKIRETTMASYKIMVRCHIKPVMGGRKLKELSSFDVRQALVAMERRGCSGQTIDKCMRVLSACLNNAMREELIFRNVAKLVEKPTYKPKKTLIWTATQSAIFIQAIKDHPQYVAFLLFLTYGMRRGEVLGLRYSDIDFENNLIHVRQQIGRVNGGLKAWDLKTESSQRSLPLVYFVRDAIVEHAERNGVAMPSFEPDLKPSLQGTIVVSTAGTPIEPRNLARCFERLIEKAGLPRIKVHAMRHIAATLLKDLGVPVKDVQQILGHSNVATTLRIYQHGTLETQRTAISAVENQLHGIIGSAFNPIDNHQQNMRNNSGLFGTVWGGCNTTAANLQQRQIM